MEHDPCNQNHTEERRDSPVLKQRSQTVLGEHIWPKGRAAPGNLYSQQRPGVGSLHCLFNTVYAVVCRGTASQHPTRIWASNARRFTNAGFSLLEIGRSRLVSVDNVEQSCCSAAAQLLRLPQQTGCRNGSFSL